MTGRSLAALAALLAVACPAAAPPEDPEPPLPRGGALRVVLVGDVDSLDPHHASRPSSWWFARALHRGLLAFPDEPGATAPVPDLAEAMPEVSANGRRYRFRLRDGLRFSNGDPVTAADVAASIRRVRRVPRGAGAGLAAVLRVRARDRTVTVTLRRRVPELPWLLAHPQAAVVPAGTAAPAMAGGVAGAGPYVVERYRPQRSITLVRSRTWGDDPVRRARAATIDARVVRTAARARAVVRDGDADLVVEPGPPDLGVPARPRVRTLRAGGSCVRYLFFSDAPSLLRRLDARRAIAHALDRDAIAAAARGSAPAPRLLPPAVTGHRPDPVLRERASDARAALARADLRGGFAFDLVTGRGARDRAEAAAVRRALRRVSIRVRIRLVDPDILYASWYEPRRAQAGLATWCADWPGLAGANVLGNIAAPGGEARYGAAAPARALGASARARRTGAARDWAAADAAIVRTAVVVPLTWPVEETPAAEELAGFVGSPMFPRGDPTALVVRP